MSKDLHNNERYLKDMAENHKPVPPPLVWDEIEQVLDRDKGKKRSFLILWIFGGLILGTIMFINLREKTDKESPIVQQEIIINDYQKQTDPNPTDINSVDSEAVNEVQQGQNANFSETVRAVSGNQEVNKVDSEELNSFVTQEQQLSNVNTTGEDRFLNSNAVNSNAVDSKATVLITKEEIFRPRTAAQSTLEDLNITQEETLRPRTAAQSALDDKNITKEEIFRPQMANQSTLEDINISKEETLRPRLANQSTLEDIKILQVTPLQRLKWIHSPVVSIIPLPDPTKNLTANFIAESKSSALTSSPWFVELGGGIGGNLSNPILIDPTQGGFRLNTETRWYSWSTSVQLGYQFDNLWYTTFGFDLNQTKNKFDFWRRDISSLIVTENRNFQISNSDFYNIGEISYTFADIGLCIGRRVNIDKWHFSLEGGAIFNFLFNADGKVQVGGLEFSRLEDQDEYFNTQIGIGGRLSAMLDYPLSDQLWISGGPTYHQYFNTISSQQNPLKERNSILQLKAKVRYYF